MKPTGQFALADFKRQYSYTSGSTLVRFLKCVTCPGLQAVLVYRMGAWLLPRSKVFTLPVRMVYGVSELMVRMCWGIEIGRSAKIGPGLYIGHFGGITISGLAVIGSNCNISQSTTIGVSGAGDKFGAPVIGNDVYIAPGARLFGKINIGDNVKVGANAVIHTDVEENAIVVMDPGFRVLSYKGNRRPAAADAH